MDLVSGGPFRVAELRWLLSSGAPALTVVCKLTYHLAPVEASIAAAQEDPVEDDAYWNDDHGKGLTAASDLVPFKKQPEVIVVGHAFAPRQQPARSLSARLVVGGVHKSIEVYADRSFTLNGQLEESGSFTKMRLSYERAAGGPETGNPIGVRFDVQDAYGRTRLPNLQPTGAFIARRGDTFAPTGFGPIAPHWPDRWMRAQRFGAAFTTRAWTERPFPEGFDASYFNVSPLDQRLEALHANERITLENLHPEHARLVTSLPGVEPAGVIERSGQPPQKLTLACDTLWIDTDRQICHLVWRGTVALSRRDEPGRVTITATGRPARAPAPLIAATTPDQDGTMTMAPMLTPMAAALLPFAGRTAEEPRSPRRAGATDALPFGDPVDPTPKPAAQATPGYGLYSDPSDGTLFLDPAGAAALSGTQPPPAALPVPPPPPAGVPSPALIPPLVSASGGALSPPAAVLPVSGISPPGAMSSQTVLPPERVIGPPIVGSAWGAGSPEIAPPEKKGSIGERLAAEQALAESKAALDKKVRDEPENVGPIQSAAASKSMEAAKATDPAPRVVDEGAAKRGWKPVGAKKTASAGAAPAMDIVRGGAAAASNSVLTPDERPRRALIDEAPKRQSPKEILELLWFDPACLPRVRRKAEWKDILTLARTRTFDDDPAADAPPDKRQEARDRKEIFTLLARGAPMDWRSIEEAMDAAVNEDGCFIPPLLLVAGEITFPFDEVETLKATIAAVTPLIGEDKRLQGAVDTAQKLLQTPWIAGASEIAEAQTTKVKEAFAAGNRSVPGSYLEHHTERMLLHQRAYRKRMVMGEEHVRGEVAISGKAVPVYLPEAAAKQLPGLMKWGARMVAEGRQRVDWRDAGGPTLRVVSLALSKASG